MMTSDEYVNFVRRFIKLLDKQFTLWEKQAKDDNKLYQLANQMPAIISLVNTVGCLRGQDGVFLDIRPRTDCQNEFYEYENIFEKRLNQLIEILMNSDTNLKKYYVEKLQDELVKLRIKQKRK